MSKRARKREVCSEQNLPPHVATPEEAAPVVQPEVPGLLERAAAKPDESPKVYDPDRRCPRCGSIRSTLLTTNPHAGGRVAWRKCKACLVSFKVEERLSR